MAGPIDNAPAAGSQEDAADLSANLNDVEWRLGHLYKIIVKGDDDADGRRVAEVDRRAVRERQMLSFEEAIHLLTQVQAELYGLKDRGLIAPGKRADIAVIDSLDGCHVSTVFAGGVEVTDAAFAARQTVPPVARHSVKAPKVEPHHFRAGGNRVETSVIGIVPGKIITPHLTFDIAPEDGDKKPDLARDLIRIAVIERHGVNGNRATGFVQGFGLKRGAIASTVCHDHHNIAVVGADYADMAVAANRLGEIEGGFVVVEGGRILAELALPVAGLMSLQPFEQVHHDLIALRAAAKSLGVVLEEPFLQLAFLALPVIPHLKITDHGMVDVDRFEVIP